MDEKQLRDAVQAIVAGIFSEKEEADRQRMTEEAITKSTSTINDLTKALAEQKDLFTDLEVKYNDALASIEEKEAAMVTSEDEGKKVAEELAAAKEELTSTKEAFEKVKSDFEALTASNEEVVKELDGLKATMAEIEAAKVAEERYTVLESDGVAYKDKDKQIAKIKGMSEEDFASYKEELLAIKEAISDNKGTAAGSDDDKDDNKVALANVAKGSASTTAVSPELKVKDDIMVKYQKLGEAMAAAMKKDE